MPSPFTIDIPDAEIDDLKARLARTRWPSEVADSGWQYGANLAYVRELCGYWQSAFDWRAAEAGLNGMPQFTAAVSADGVDGYNLHFVHKEGAGPDPLPLVFTHGWPGTFYEVSKILGPLTDPAAYGGDPADAFTVVAPSLPGYGFSEIPSAGGFGQKRTALLWGALMQELGYDRYGAQGGDWGAIVTSQVGWNFPDNCVGCQINMPVARPPEGVDPADFSDEEKAIAAKAQLWQAQETGYQWIQGTRPQTLAYGLTDSPAGLAGWITEKWRAWSDNDGDIEQAFSKDEILTNISIYWFTGTINSSTRYYYEMRQNPGENMLGGKLQVPVGYSIFPREIITAPKSWVEAGVEDLRQWSVHDSGGHFAALERPDALVRDIRDFFRPLR